MDKKRNEKTLTPNPRIIKLQSSNSDVFISIKVGNAHIGSSKIIINAKEHLRIKDDKKHNLGNISNLKDKDVEINTFVSRTPGTNDTAIITTTIYDNNSQLYEMEDKGSLSEDGKIKFIGHYKLITSIIIFLLLQFANITIAQTSNQLEFKNLETPSTPGLILFDETDAAIEKPTTPEGLGFSLLGLGRQGGAIEFAPYWLFNHPNLSVDKYISNITPVLSHFSVSLASLKTDTSQIISGGFRVRLVQFYGNQLSTMSDLVDKIKDAQLDEDMNREDSLWNEYSQLLSKPVFNIDFAGAIGAISITNSFSTLEIQRWAVWMTLNWRPKGDDFYITTLARYINKSPNTEYNFEQNQLDIGSRLNYDISRVTISMEYLHRLDFTTDQFDDYRLAAICSYRILKNIFVTATFGKNFSEIDNIIALGGVKFGFSKSKIESAY